MKVVASFDRWIKEINKGSAESLFNLYDGLYDVGFSIAEVLMEEPDPRDLVVFSAFVEQWLKKDGFHEIETTRNALNLAVREKCKEIYKLKHIGGAVSWASGVPGIGGFHPLMLQTAYKAELMAYEKNPGLMKKVLFFHFLRRISSPEIARICTLSEVDICRIRDDGIRFLMVLRSSQSGRYGKV